MRPKYHATLELGWPYKPIKFTAVDLEALMKRFNKEVAAERARRNEARDYTFIVPNLTVEVK